MEIRQLTVADQKAFERFEKAMLEDAKVNPFTEWRETGDFESFVRQSDLSESRQEGQTWSTYTRFYGFIDGEIVGLLSCFWDIDHPDCQTLGHLGYMVAPSFRGNGIASQLVSYGLERYRERGVRSIYIAMAVDNMASRKTAEKAGGNLLGIFQIAFQGKLVESAKYEVIL